MKVKDVHLIAFYVTKPKNPRMTHVKGYMSDPANHQYDERLEFTVGLKSKDQLYAGIVLNLNTKTIVKNKFKNEQTFDDLFKYFLEAYPDYVSKAMSLLDPVYLEQFLPKKADPESTTAEAVETVAE